MDNINFKEKDGKYLLYSTNIPLLAAGHNIEEVTEKLNKLKQEMTLQLQEFEVDETASIEKFVKAEKKLLKLTFIKWFIIVLAVIFSCAVIERKFKSLKAQLPTKLSGKIDKIINAPPKKQAERIERFRTILNSARPYIKELKDSFSKE
ncbi:MAG: hypothetical protein ISR65_07695 [Bacteriovoracaceae bacterium]|nr:hypothetical protein [Bacteriovoracaceae bacterium]